MTFPIRAGAVIAAIWTLAACGGVDASGPPARHSPTRYDGACPLVGIEETPVLNRQPEDSIAVVLRYRFGETPPWEVVSQLARSDIRDPQFELQIHPTTLCTPSSVVRAASGS
jgi:hypothetical protein